MQLFVIWLTVVCAAPGPEVFCGYLHLVADLTARTQKLTYFVESIRMHHITFWMLLTVLTNNLCGCECHVGIMHLSHGSLNLNECRLSD